MVNILIINRNKYVDVVILVNNENLKLVILFWI